MFRALFIVFITSVYATLNITFLSVPEFVYPGQDVVLECRYEGIFSILSWVKDYTRFFIYRPDDILTLEYFPLPGIKRVEMELCGPEICRIRLAGLSEEATGLYTCDIEYVEPPFGLSTKTSYMNVSNPTSKRPIIEDLAPQYSDGDLMHAFCRTEKNTEVRWYINGHEIEHLRGSQHFEYVSSRRLYMRKPPMLVVQCSEVLNGKVIGSAGVKTLRVRRRLLGWDSLLDFKKNETKEREESGKANS